MSKIKRYGEFGDKAETAEQIMSRIESNTDRYRHIQVITNSPGDNEALQRYLWENSEMATRCIDALGGTAEPDGYRRYSLLSSPEFEYLKGLSGEEKKSEIEKALDAKFEEIIHMAPTAIGCGIKVVKNPIGRLMNYEQWPGGYIEGYIRMDSDDPRYGEYFVWTYLRMEMLGPILERFEGKLRAL